MALIIRSITPDGVKQAKADLRIIANQDAGLGFSALPGNDELVTFARHDSRIPAIRLEELANTDFGPDHGKGPQQANIVILPVKANFTLDDGTLIRNHAGITLPPQNSGLRGAERNNTDDCLVIYDVSQNDGQGYCAAREGTGGKLNLPTPNPVILYHELSHALRVVTNTQLGYSRHCNPASVEEMAAISDENDVRAQIAAMEGCSPSLRDPRIYCGCACAQPPAPTTKVGKRVVAPLDPGEEFAGFHGALTSLVEDKDGYELSVALANRLAAPVYHDASARAIIYEPSRQRLRLRLHDEGRGPFCGFMTVTPGLVRLAPRSESTLTIRLPKTIVRLADARRMSGCVLVEEHAVGAAEEISLEIGWRTASGRHATSMWRTLCLSSRARRLNHDLTTSFCTGKSQLYRLRLARNQPGR